MERTLVLVKPDGVQRGLIGEIIARLERRGLRLVAAKFMQVDTKLAETHYAIHKGKPFYNGLVKYITASPLMPSSPKRVISSRTASRKSFSSRKTPRHTAGILDSAMRSRRSLNDYAPRSMG